MKTAAIAGRSFYAAATIVYGIQQFIYGNFRPVQLPAWQAHIPLLNVFAYLAGIGLIVAGGAIIISKKGKEASLILGVVFLCFFLFMHVPYEFFGEVNSSLHLALWTDALKELALSGGAFVVAGSFQNILSNSRKRVIPRFLVKLISFGQYSFASL